MVPLLLLPLLWGRSLQQPPGYELQVQESVTVQEGLCVHVPCSFYPWSSWSSSTKVYTYWYRYRDNRNHPVASSNPDIPGKTETQGRFLLTDPTTNNCSLQIRDARRNDTGRYYLRVEIGNSVRYSYLDKMLNLQVTALTEKPHIRMREPLESGCPTELACSLPGSCEGGRSLTFSWAGAAVDLLDPQTLGSSALTVTPRPQDHGTNLTCQVQVQGSLVAMQRTVRLNVSYAPCGAWRWRGAHLLGSQLLSFSLSEQNNPHSSRCVTQEPQGSWPLVFTLIRGTLMGAGFLLTYVLTWLYYTRCGGPRSRRQSS